MTTSRAITAQELRILKDIIRKRRPSMLNALEEAGTRRFSDAERDSLREAVLEELLEKGIDLDDAPTPHGRILDELIGRLDVL